LDEYGNIIVEFEGNNSSEVWKKYGYDSDSSESRQTEYEGHLSLSPETVCDMVCKLLKKEEK
jgi:hypothetical protein